MVDLEVEVVTMASIDRKVEVSEEDLLLLVPHLVLIPVITINVLNR